jgi:hypothetical protein
VLGRVEAFGLSSVFIGRQAFESFKTFGEVVGHPERIADAVSDDRVTGSNNASL